MLYTFVLPCTLWTPGWTVITKSVQVTSITACPDTEIDLHELLPFDPILWWSFNYSLVNSLNYRLLFNLGTILDDRLNYKFSLVSTISIVFKIVKSVASTMAKSTVSTMNVVFSLNFNLRVYDLDYKIFFFF